MTDVRGRGLMVALELKTAEQAAQLVQRLSSADCCCSPPARAPCASCPPLVLDREEAATGLEIIASALD